MAIDEDQEPPLHLAAFYGHLDAVERLLKLGADIDELSTYGTPLDRAAFGGHVAVIAALLNKGALATTKNYWGRTPLHEAAREGHLEAVRLLLRRGAEVDPVDQIGNGRTPLHEAMGPGDAAIVELLLLYGANIEHRNSWGARPLHMAARMGATDVVNVLLQAGADRNATDEQGHTALGEATKRNYTEIISILKTQPTPTDFKPERKRKMWRRRDSNINRRVSTPNLDRYQEAMRVLKEGIKSTGYMSSDEMEFQARVLGEARKDLGFRYQPGGQARIERNQEARRVLGAQLSAYKSAEEITSETKVLPLDNLLQLDRIKSQQELAHEVQWLSPRDQPLLVIFVSHRWEDSSTPDPYGTQLRILKAISETFLDIAVGLKEHRDKRLERLPTLTTHGALQATYFIGAIADFIDGFEAGEAALRQALLRRVGIFYDFMSLPQCPRTNDEQTEFLQGMRKFRKLVASTPTLVLRYPDDEYSLRSWCEVEFWSGGKSSGPSFSTVPVIRMEMWGKEIDVLKLGPPENWGMHSNFSLVLEALSAWKRDDYVTAKGVAETIMLNYDNAFSWKEKESGTPMITRPCFRAHNESSISASPRSFQFWNSIREKLCLDGIDNEDFGEILKDHLRMHGLRATEETDLVATGLWLLNCHELSFDRGFVVFYGRCLLRYLFEGKDLNVSLFFRLPNQQVHFKFADGEESLEG